MSGRHRGRGGHPGGGKLPRDVMVSKKISWLLRHGAEKEGLKLGAGGYVNVKDALNSRTLKSLQITFDELREVVATNEKQRFSMIPVAALTAPSASSSDAEKSLEAEVTAAMSTTDLDKSDPSNFLIRANQGHSIKVEADGLLTPITLDDEATLPETVVHGTDYGSWSLIVKTGGLKRMGRNHIHFAAGLPKGFKQLPADGDAEKTEETGPVISGMRNSSSILIYIDLSKALKAGVPFWRSENGVILSEGMGEEEGKGVVGLQFFKRVEERRRGLLLAQDGEVVMELPEDLKKMGRGRGGRGGHRGGGAAREKKPELKVEPDDEFAEG